MQLLTKCILFKLALESLLESITNRDIVQVNRIIANGADIIQIEDSTSPLLHALKELQQDSESTELQTIITSLLHAKSNPNVYDKDGISPIMAASRVGDANIVSLLLQHRAVVDCNPSSKTWTPLLLAVSNNHMPVVKVLLDARADVDCVSYYQVCKDNPLITSVRSMRNFEMTKLLLENKADHTLVDGSGMSVLMLVLRWLPDHTQELLALVNGDDQSDVS